MASPMSKAAFFLLVNVLFFAAASACRPVSSPAPPPPPPPPPPRPKVAPCPPPPATGKCPTDTLKLGACANVLNGLINGTVSDPPKEPCCTLLDGLVDVDAAVCLCTVIKKNILGIINLNIPIDLSVVLNYCGKGAPKGYQCN